MKLIGIAAAAAALALPSLALGEDATYDETQNWLAAWGQTQKDWTDPAETGGTVVNSAGNAAANAQDPNAPSRALTSFTSGRGREIPTASRATRARRP